MNVSKVLKISLIGFAVLFLLFIIFAIVSPSPTTSEKTTEKESQEIDASATIACRDFRKAIVDVKNGILTDEEFRERIQKVYNNARLADEKIAPDVSDSSLKLLQAITSGTTKETTEATTSLEKACSGPGIKQ